MPSWTNSVVAALGRLLSWSVGVVSVVLVLYWISSNSALDWWKQLLGVLVAFAVGFIAVALSRYALGSTISSDAPPTASGSIPDLNAPVRSRLAPLIIGVGMTAIIVLALALVLAFYYAKHQGIQGKLDTLLLAIFSAVLPVFATWVGTILAFYYSNESFKQASDAARAGPTGTNSHEQITSGNRIIPYEKIARKDLSSGADPDAVAMSEVRAKFSPPVTRFVVFRDQRPVYVIRSKLDFPAAEQTSSQTIKDYLSREKNRADAENFRFIPLSTSVDDARKILEVYRVADLFANESGSSRDPVKGWVTDDTLRA